MRERIVIGLGRKVHGDTRQADRLDKQHMCGFMEDVCLFGHELIKICQLEQLRHLFIYFL